MPWIAGYPREKIDWYPKVNPEKCVKCGMCMNCGRGVYRWTSDGPKVVNPYNCIVGCSTCANLCPASAISFPEAGSLKEIYKEKGIYAKVRAQLEQEGKLRIAEQSQDN